MRRLPAVLLLALASLVTSACGNGNAPPRFQELSALFEPEDLRATVTAWHTAAGWDAGEIQDVEVGLSVRHVLPADGWREDEPGLWSVPWPGGAFDFGYEAFLRLDAGPRWWRGEVIERSKGRLRVRASDAQAARKETLSPLSADALRGATLSQRLEIGRREPGGTRWQLRAATFYGIGIPVWSDRSVEIPCAVPANGRLSFGTRFLAQEGAGPATFRVRLDGELVHESVLEPALFVAGAERVAVLPPGRRPHARLFLEVTGAAGQGQFTHPVLGPAEIGSYGERPWKGAPPDIVLFLADTFRADNLAISGGDPTWTPNLNAFATRSTAFTRARSVASWTLPAISSLLTGLWPPQHTAEDDDRALPQGLKTIVERLAEAGYRTCAVTDSGFFVQSYGLDQGFESFRQIPAQDWELDQSLRHANDFLEADDGRPLLLLVHSYRTHIPYRVGPDEITSTYEALAERHPLVNAKEHMPAARYDQSLAESVEEYSRLYRAGAQDLDRGFGLFQGELERRGILGAGLVVFVSDHGEALGENREIFHDGDLWETKLRIPLILNGPGFGARLDDSPVALVDLAPTLARVAGVARDPDWVGVALDGGEAQAERHLLAFRSRAKTLKQVALAIGAHKVLVRDPQRLGRGECDQAYDLATDPGEDEDLCGSAEWVHEVAREGAQATRRALQAAAELQETTPTAELIKIGYGDN